MSIPAPARPAAQAQPTYSLRRRLLLGTLGWVLLAVLTAGWGLRDLFQSHIQAQLQDQLLMQLNQLSGAVRSDAQGQLHVPPLATDPRWSTPLSGLYWQIDSQAQGQAPRMAAARSRSLWDQVLPLPAQAEWDAHAPEGHSVWTLHQEGQRLLAVSRHIHLPEEGAPTLRITVAADERLLAEPLGRFTTMLLIALGTLAAGLLMAAAVQMQWLLRPLQQLRQHLGAVHAGDAAQLQGHYPQELTPLVTTLNHVLASNAEMVQRARTQAGNLAHALNTPLSILTNAAAQDPSALGQLVQEQVAHARRHVDYHLARARAGAAVRATGLACPVQPTTQALLRTMARLYPAVDFGLNAPAAPLHFKGEVQDLFEMLGNLLDNAGKWAHRQVSVTLAPATAPGMLLITVDDDGPGIADAAQRQQIFQRGERLDENRPGAGLGLNIVQVLAQTYGGDVRAEPSALGGLQLQLQLPLSTTTAAAAA